MNKIAITGMSCLFPGASTPEEYWNNLIQGKDSRSRAAAEQMGEDPDAFFSPVKGEADRYYCAQGGYVRGFVPDLAGFALPEETLKGLDPVFLWPLHTARKALEDSGCMGKGALARTGLVLGNLSFPTRASNALFIPMYERVVARALGKVSGKKVSFAPWAKDENPGMENAFISGHPAALICQALGLQGPRLALDAACASSLYAVRLACDYLNTGRADVMLAGAVSAADPFFVHMGFSIFQAYPEGKESKPLDKTSGGLVAGEGAGMFVLKRLDGALADGDRIYAVISGAGLSNDGRGASVLSPNPKGQALAFERAYKDSGMDPARVGCVECHATGTPLGDAVELESMEAFFGKHKAAPVLGSVKSSLGHMLTAAGMGGMTKIILSLMHGQVPGTINVNTPLAAPGSLFDGKIPAQTAPWPGEGKSPAGAVSAFGFGGTNAHVIFESPDANASVKAGKAAPLPEKEGGIAIVGMDAHFGPCADLDAFLHTVYEGVQHGIALPPQRWKGLDKQKGLLESLGFKDGRAPRGGYIEKFDLDFLRFKIPPNPDDQLICQQMLAMKTADKALARANIAPGGNVAVIMAMGAEMELHRFRGRVNLETRLPRALERAGLALGPEERGELVRICKDVVHNAAKVNQYTSFIGNIMASRVSSLWNFSGPAFTVSAGENSVFRAVEAGSMLLAKGEVDAVVVGAVDLSGSPENVLLQGRANPVNTGRFTLSFDRSVNGWTPGEGAGAVVLKRLDKAMENRDHVVCAIRSLAFTSGSGPHSLVESLSGALSSALARLQDVGLVEACASGTAAMDQTETQALTQFFQARNGDATCALGSVKANIGHCFAASQMAALIKTALCLQYGFIPRTPGWAGPKDPAAWENTLFYVPDRSRPWFTAPGQTRRIAAVTGLSQDQTASAMVLASQPQPAEQEGIWNLSGPWLLLFSADTPAELENALDQCARDLEQGIPLREMAFRCFTSLKQGEHRLAVAGATVEEIQSEMDAAKKGMAQAMASGKDWQSLKGSSFSPKPLGAQGKIAFVYPGGFCSYPQMGRDFFQLFPQCRDSVHQGDRLGDLMGERLLYPRSMTGIPQGLQVHALEKNPITMFETGILFAIARTDAVRKGFGIQPHMALGYSMGEISMMYSLGVWERTDAMSKVLRRSPVFSTRLAGPMETVRQAWSLPRQKDPDERIWHGFALRASADAVRSILDGLSRDGKAPRAYLLFTNTPNEVVIAGEEKACLKVIKKANCEYYEAPMGDAIHCDLVRADYDEMVRLHTLEVKPVSGVDFYTAVGCRKLDAEKADIARNIADMYCTHVDFAALVQKAYEDGARVFIELGPREHCTNWIRETLAGKDFAAVATDRKGAPCKNSLIRALAMLFVHHTPMDLSFIYPGPGEKMPEKSLVRTIFLGGEDMEQAIISQAGPLFAQPKTPEPLARKEIPQPPPSKAMSAPGAAPKAPAQSPPGPGPAPKPFGPGPMPGLAARPAAPARVRPATTMALESQSGFLDRNMALASRGHQSFLRNRSQALEEIEKLIALQTQLLGRGGKRQKAPAIAAKAATPSPSAPEVACVKAKSPAAAVPAQRQGRDAVIWDREALETFAGGKIADVFGPEYAVIDGYGRRVRLPLDPYLLVSRVTKLGARRGEFKPSTMTTEFDIEPGAWFLVDGQIPWAVSVESGQCDLLLISYLGIDFDCKGFRVYRLLDCTLTFLDDLAKEGQTLRYDISINTFAKSGGNLLFFFSYECFVGDRMVLKMDGGCAGFFSDGELAAGKGIIRTEAELKARAAIVPKSFTPMLSCEKRAFGKEDLLAIIQGRPAACFGPDYDQGGANPSLKFAAEKMLMVDRVQSVDPQGGPWGLGEIIAHKDLRPDHWYFPCHFKDDEVMAGSLMAEGCVQLLQFFTLFLGLQTKTRDARFQPIVGLPQKVRCRGQVIPKDTLLTYRMEVKEIGLEPEPYAVADVDILLGDKVVVDFKDLGVRLAEKKPEPVSLKEKPEAAAPPAKAPVFDKHHLVEFATGDIAQCFGPAYVIYKDRQPPRTPNGDLQLISRVLEATGTPGDFRNRASVVSEYDAPMDAWFCRANAWPRIMPYSMFMEIALQPCGFISTYVQTTLMIPEKDMFFRNLDGQGTLFSLPDLRGKTITNRSTLLSTAKAGGAIIQKFTFELEAEGAVFYKGTAAFGYFTKEALVDQIGLDGGKDNHPLTTREFLENGAPVLSLDLQGALPPGMKASPDKPHYGLSGPQLRFLDRVLIRENSGRFGKGYIYADKMVNPADWFYPCHFHNDPVMPGSLGVEAMLQALQAFALQQGLGRDFKNPHFTQITEAVTWKYRGQIIPSNKRMSLELHIKEIVSGGQGVIIKADASLWKENIRIYEVTDLGLKIADAG